MGGSGGGGGSTIQPLPWGQQQKDTGKGIKFQLDKFYNFWNKDPLLSAGREGALGFWDQLPGMLDQFGGFQSQLSDYQKQLGGYQNQLGNISGGIGGLIGQLPGLSNQLGGFSNQLGNLYGQTGKLGQSFGKFLGPKSALSKGYNQIGQTIAGGGYSPYLQRMGAQIARTQASASGTTHDTSALINEYQQREDVRNQALNQALGQSQGILGQQAGAAGALQNIYGQQAGIAGQRAGITGQQAGLLGLGGQLYGQQAGIAGQQAGITGMGAGITGQQAGLLGQQQALQSGALNQLFGAGNAAVGQYGGLTNPVWAAVAGNYQNQNAANIANAQIAAQQQAAGDSKTAGLIGGGASAIGGVALAAL